MISTKASRANFSRCTRHINPDDSLLTPPPDDATTTHTHTQIDDSFSIAIALYLLPTEAPERYLHEYLQCLQRGVQGAGGRRGGGLSQNYVKASNFETFCNRIAAMAMPSAQATQSRGSSDKPCPVWRPWTLARTVPTVPRVATPGA